MSTYEQIQVYVKQNHGFVPETCWIADAKERFGLPVKKAWNRKGEERKKPCPPGKLDAIRDAFMYYEIIESQ